MLKKAQFHCALCDRHFNEKRSLEYHIRSQHTLERPFKCDICSRAFFSSGKLTERRKTHSDRKPFQCHVCQRKFRTRGTLRKHEVTHQKHEKTFQCSHCHFKSHASQYLKRHVKTAHEKWKLDQFQCIFCTRTFFRKEHLELHLRSETRERPFFCKYCSNEFSIRSSMLRHVRRDHNPKRELSHECYFCPKHFFDKYEFAKHMGRHTGEKTFKCGECSKDFITNYELKRHFIQAHTLEKNHECEICLKRFKLPEALNVHKKSHIAPNEKIFECSVCKKKFSTSRFLKDHADYPSGPGEIPQVPSLPEVVHIREVFENA